MSSTDTKAISIGVAASLIAVGITSGISALSALPAVPVPIWLISAVICGPLVWLWLRHFYKDRVTQVANQDFAMETVVLDGKMFTSCKFDRTKMVFYGKKGFGFARCRFDKPQFVFEGSAGITANQIAILNTDQGFAKVVEGLLREPPKHKIKRAEQGGGEQPATRS